MPMVLTSIAGVSQRRVLTKHGWRTKYDVLAGEQNGAGYAPAYETWNAWYASLCDRAAKTGRLVRLGLRDTKWTPEIVSAEIQ